MPVVPVSPGRRVQTAALPGAQINSSAPSAAFGVQSPIDLSGPTRLAGEIMQREKQKADQVALLDADNQLNETATQLQVQASQHRGKDAMGFTSAAAEQWRERARKIRAGLASDEQKMQFDAREANHWGQLSQSFELHAAAEAQKYDDDTTKAALENRANAAITDDPAKVGNAIAETRAIVADYAHRNGLSPERAKAFEAEKVSDIHVGIISHMLAAEQDQTAAQYFAEHKAEITGDALPQVEHAIHLGSTLGEAMRQADEIISTTDSFDAAKAKARQITDPKVREEAEQRIRREYDDRAASQRQEQAQVFQTASGILERTGDFHKIPLALRTKMSPEENSALQRREDQMRHPKRETDMALYTTLMTMAGLNAATRNDFLQANLAQFRNQLAEDDFKALVNLQLRIREETQRGDQKATLMGEDVPDRTVPPDIRFNIPQAWADSAASNPAYLRYLRHMRVPLPAPSGGTGDINLGTP